MSKENLKTRNWAVIKPISKKKLQCDLCKNITTKELFIQIKMYLLFYLFSFYFFIKYLVFFFKYRTRYLVEIIIQEWEKIYMIDRSFLNTIKKEEEIQVKLDNLNIHISLIKIRQILILIIKLIKIYSRNKFPKLQGIRVKMSWKKHNLKKFDIFIYLKVYIFYFFIISYYY